MLGIIDGVIVPHDMIAGLLMKINDVPVIFGTMAQEIDFEPAVLIENYTAAEYGAYITNRYICSFNYSVL